MFVRIGPRVSVAALTCAWLLVATGPASAQAPPGETTEQRLRRLEEKIDKLADTVAAPRGAAPNPAPALEREIELLMKAHTVLHKSLDEARREYLEFRKSSPVLQDWSIAGGANLLTDRLAKIDQRRLELRIKQAQQQETYTSVRRTREQFGPHVALQTMAALGVKAAGVNVRMPAADRLAAQIAAERKAKAEALGPQHPEVQKLDGWIEQAKRLAGGGDKDVAPVDAIAAALAAMEAELENTKLLIAALDTLFETEHQNARALQRAELQDQQMKESLEQQKKMFDVLMKRIQEIELSRHRSEAK